jgi:hypothetical protein
MKSPLNRTTSAEHERLNTVDDAAVQKFKAIKRLSPHDQRMAAINLGKLAATLNPANPSKGAQQIAVESKLVGVLEKRKRFFRLPNEEAPAAAKDGTYNANPGKFLTLAGAAGRLLCGSSDKGLQEKDEARARRMLLLGTSLLPTYMPETQVEKSVVALVEEYAVRLAEAIVQRTRITELWKALESTPITVEASDEPLSPSIYGVSANLPSELLRPLFRDYIQHAQFEPSTHAALESWAEPTLFLGYLMLSYDLYALVIPDEKAHLFPAISKDSRDEFETCSAERNEWLDSIGFDVIQHRFHDGNRGREQKELSKVAVGFIHKVGLSLRKGHRGRVELELHTWRSSKEDNSETDFLVSTFHATGGRGFKNVLLQEKFLPYVRESDYDWPVRPVTIGPAFVEENQDEYSFDAYCEEYGANCYLAENCSSLYGKPTKVLLLKDCFDPEYWDNEDDYEEYRELIRAEGWIKESGCAKLLLGAPNMTFVPSIKEAEPVAGAARAGSIAASILENALSATPESRISQILIDRVALTAEAGLRFHDAVIETTRSALIKI